MRVGLRILKRETESRRWFRGVGPGAGAGAAERGDAGGRGGGCESDIYELPQWQRAHREEAGLVVRANASRQRKVQVWDPGLRAVMRRTLESQPDFKQPVKTGRQVCIDSQGGAGRGRSGQR